jgi:D-alanyl-D-alanine carboxypeptidase
MRNLVLIAFLILFNACKKDKSHVATTACTTDYNFVDTSSEHPKATVYQALLNDLINGGVPGATIMIEDSAGLWIGSKGYADIENKTNFQSCHSIKVASITKLFNAVLIYKLIEENKLLLQDKISKYIDADIIKKLKNSEQCTIADLLQHSSGMFDFVFSAPYILYTFNNIEKEKTYEEILRFAYDKEPAFPYGSKRDYNYTVNYILLAMIINKLEGKDHALVQREKIFNPLQLTHTFYRPQEDIPWSNIARGYFDYRKKGTLQELTSLFTGDGTGFTGIYSTTNDLRKYINALYREKTIIYQASITAMLQCPNYDDSISYGVGCRIYGVPKNGITYHFYGHPGGEVNYASGAYYCPEKRATVTYLLNYGDAFNGAYSDKYLFFRREILRKVVE